MRLDGWLWVTTFNGVVLLAVLTLPLALLAVVALAILRRRRGWAVAWRHALAEVAMVHGTVPFVWMTMLPGSQAGRVDGRVSLEPLADLPTMGTLGIVGNLLILAALGFFAPVRWARLATLPRMVAVGVACSTLIETAQYVLRLDRVSSVDDVLLNGAGAAMAALLSRPWWAGRESRVADQATLRATSTLPRTALE